MEPSSVIRTFYFQILFSLNLKDVAEYRSSYYLKKELDLMLVLQVFPVASYFLDEAVEAQAQGLQLFLIELIVLNNWIQEFVYLIRVIPSHACFKVFIQNFFCWMFNLLIAHSNHPCFFFTVISHLYFFKSPVKSQFCFCFRITSPFLLLF